MPYTFSAEEIQAEIKLMNEGLIVPSRYTSADDRERVLTECIAELRLRVSRLEQWIGNL